ncbi:hypothetical protein U1Q18_030984 [Sarracenia purpurea var. burkii]
MSGNEGKQLDMATVLGARVEAFRMNREGSRTSIRRCSAEEYALLSKDSGRTGEQCCDPVGASVGDTSAVKLVLSRMVVEFGSAGLIRLALLELHSMGGAD